MAIVQNPLINRASGAVGNSIFSKWKDRNVLKSKSINPYPEPTPAQIASRAIFKNCIDFQLPIKPFWPYICVGRQFKLSPSNYFVKQNRNLFTAGTDIITELSIPSLVFSIGYLQALICSSIQFVSPLSYRFAFYIPEVGIEVPAPTHLIIYAIDSYTKKLYVYQFSYWDIYSPVINFDADCSGHLCYLFSSFYSENEKQSSISNFFGTQLIN